MDNSFKIIYEAGYSEITEKKSRFIANVYNVEDEEQVSSYINAVKKEYWDAKHNCYAFVIGENNQIQRYSDDGEPAGTAGKPILETILNNKIHNCLIIVTRYFGGILLGTGGLVRAYGLASKEGLNNSVIIKKQFGKLINVVIDYSKLDKIQYIVSLMGLCILHIEYTEMVCVFIVISDELVNEFQKKINEVTAGKAKIECKGDQCFSNIDGKIILLQ